MKRIDQMLMFNCPECQKQNYIDLDYEKDYFVCEQCGKSVVFTDEMKRHFLSYKAALKLTNQL